jgi:hypothetical protein
MVTWRNRSIDTLSTAELRLALNDAINQIAWSRSAADASSSFFSTLLFGFGAGAVVAAGAALLVSGLA